MVCRRWLNCGPMSSTTTRGGAREGIGANPHWKLSSFLYFTPVTKVSGWFNALPNCLYRQSFSASWGWGAFVTVRFLFAVYKYCYLLTYLLTSGRNRWQNWDNIWRDNLHIVANLLDWNGRFHSTKMHRQVPLPERPLVSHSEPPRRQYLKPVCFTHRDFHDLL